MGKNDEQGIFLLLGTNQGDRLRHLTEARKLLSESQMTVLRASPIVETPAWGFESDFAFLNQVLHVKYDGSPTELLELILDAEKSLGRLRFINGYSDRIIDIDILLFDNITMQTEALTLPHPRMHLRKFTLEPLHHIAPNLIHPIFNLSIEALLSKCPDDSVCKIIFDQP